MTDTELIERFVLSFEKFDDLLAFGPVSPELDAGLDDSPWARQKWRPAPIPTPTSALAPPYLELPGRLPPIYERLVLSYRWLDVELDGVVTLLANPPGSGLENLLKEMTADRVFVDVLFPLGLIPFGRAPGGSYDPLCFDTNRRHSDQDCPVVRVEHEAVLCNLRMGESSQVASSCRSMMEIVVNKAGQIQT